MRSDAPPGASGSLLISGLSFIYFLVAVAGICVAGLGKLNAPAPLQPIDGAGKRAAVMVQARATTETARLQKPENPILAAFYKAWVLEWDLEELSGYTQPVYEGHSFDSEVEGFNRTVTLIDEMYRKATTELTVLSAGAVLLSAVMLLSTGFLRALLLAGWPAGAAFICIAFLDVGNDYLEYVWIPFVALGTLIFLLQLVHSFKFGRPEHRTPGNEPGLVIYRRGLALVNLGAFLVITSLLMASGSLSGSSGSGRAMLAQAVLGDEGVAAIGLFAGVCMLLPGIYYMSRRPTDGAGLKGSWDGRRPTREGTGHHDRRR